ncbi:hypothetical protein [Bosea minatitlanensis]|uniref:RES domain-containing protein n=1 Tax=Bosea minatitlanensis TaxID=128782 RepID=A0ABW0F0Y8_9HYPH|nr:hypothetical protein [Bosea minatitlanensis]MCT4496048.1 hypothetical protein [Bosea minatitlanensis]
MKWRSYLSPSGWIVELTDGEAWRISFRPNQFGRIISYSRRGTDFDPGFGCLYFALGAARKACPPVGRSGRYGSRASAVRGELCDAIVAVLNDQRIFPAPSVSAER